MDVEEKTVGAFGESLKRNNKQIRNDRAQAIVEDTEMIFKRKIEDIELSIKRLRRDLEAMLDLSPTTATSLTPVKDFDPEGYVSRDMEIGLQIRNAEIKLEIAQNRFKYLFGGK